MIFTKHQQFLLSLAWGKSMAHGSFQTSPTTTSSAKALIGHGGRTDIVHLFLQLGAQSRDTEEVPRARRCGARPLPKCALPSLDDLDLDAMASGSTNGEVT